VAGATPIGLPPASSEIAAEADALAARLARRVGEEAIGAGLERLALVLVPDAGAPARAGRLRAATEGRPAALGPSVPLARAGLSVRRAIATHALLAGGRLGDVPFARAEEHLPALVIAADPALAGELAEQRLAPLAELPEGPRERLTETLRAWLDRPGQVQAVAAELDVHPQTVRYRVKQLRELFGERLEDPEARFELSLALRAG
jgi:PucR C-terminal helix-turn-helix domain